MANRRIWGKYERARLRPGKDEDLYDAIDYQVQTLKKDFADVARDALRAYLGLIPGGPAQILNKVTQEEQSAAVNLASSLAKAITKTDIGDLKLNRKEPTLEDLERKADSFLNDE